MNTNGSSEFGAAFALSFLILFSLIGTFSFGYTAGKERGKGVGEKNVAFVVVRSLNRVKGVPQNLFSDEDIKGLSYDSQNILRLAK